MTLPRPRARLIIGLTLVWIVLAFLLPVALAVSATFFWGRGVIEKEGVLFAVNYLRQFTLGRIFKLFTDVGNRHGIGQPRVSYGWDHWLEHINANYFRFDSPRNRGGVGHRIVRAPAEISRQQDRAELQRRGGSFRSFAFHVQREGILHA